MRTLRPVTCTLLLALGLSGCGTAGGEPVKVEAPSPSAGRLFGDCKADSRALDDAAVIAEADLDGSGATNEIGHVAEDAGGPCANSLVATLGGELSAFSLGDAALDQDSAEVVRLVGTERQLLLVREEAHPRGGFQTRLLGHDEDGLGEIRAAGQPLLAFVATDGGGLPATATCAADGGIAVVTATPHETPKGALAWDVRRTTYSLEGNTAEQDSSTQVREAVDDSALRRETPQLFEQGGYLSDCVLGAATR